MSKTRRGARGSVYLRSPEGRDDRDELMRQQRQFQKQAPQFERQFNQYEVDPASLSYEDVESIVSNRVKKRVMKTKEFQRQAERQPEKPKGFFARVWHGIKRAASWVWEQFCKLVDIVMNAIFKTIRWIWNNGGEQALRNYAARELTAMLR